MDSVILLDENEITSFLNTDNDYKITYNIENGTYRKIILTTKCGENGKIFGSITSKEIADELAKNNFDVDKKKIVLPSPIKNSGIYSITAKLYPSVSTTFKLEVVAE